MDDHTNKSANADVDMNANINMNENTDISAKTSANMNANIIADVNSDKNANPKIDDNTNMAANANAVIDKNTNINSNDKKMNKDDDDAKGYLKAEKLVEKDINGIWRYTKGFIWFLAIIVLLALFFAIISCKNAVQDREVVIYQGINNAYVSINGAQTNYILAANKAIEDSLPTIAVLFKAGETMENIHRQGIIKAYNDFSTQTDTKLKEKYSLTQFDTIRNLNKYFAGQPLSFTIDSTKMNLFNLMQMQSFMVNDLFQELWEIAKREGDPYMSDLYLMYLESEQSAYRLYSDAYKYFDSASDFTDKYMVCPLCGNIYMYGDGVDKCGICGTPVSKFVTVK